MIAGKPLGRPSGFTLIELLVTIAVAVILATVAVPGFQSLVTTNRQAADFNEILVGLNYARSEAVKRRQEVSVVIANTGGAWSLKVQQGDDVIREMEARHDRIVVSPNLIAFNSLGRRSSCNFFDADGVCIVQVGDSDAEIVVSPSGVINKRSVGM